MELHGRYEERILIRAQELQLDSVADTTRAVNGDDVGHCGSRGRFGISRIQRINNRFITQDNSQSEL